MGMAASQARYLALVARKSNCEYEGQQINQSRLVLSNQSAELFNQMLTLEVPSPPNKSDYTYNQYSYKVGDKTYTIDKWDQLAAANSDGFNYVVTYHYNSSEYTGYQKYRLNPQVQFSGSVPTSSTSYTEQIAKIESALKEVDKCKQDYKDAENAYKTLMTQASNLTYYRDSDFNYLTKASVDPHVDQGYYIITQTLEEQPQSRTYYQFDKLQQPTQEIVLEAIQTLKDYGAIDKDLSTDNVYYDTTSGTIVFQSDIDSVADGSSSILNAYHPELPEAEEGEKSYHGIKNVKEAVDKALQTMQTAKSALDIAQATYDALDVPSYVGNLPLTPLSTLDDNQVAAISQIMTNMREEEIDTNLRKCFNTLDGTYNANTYIGGIYTFDQGTSTVYTTYYDLANSIINGTGINNIDNQEKLPYYGAENIDVPKTATERAVVESDQSGRFISIRFENDSIVYPLSSETTTDEIAYDDAMSDYNYKKALYDKSVQDINAKTSIIHRQDQNLELRLKQLDTEQNALNTEIDAVSKVVKDNIEKSFKTFGG